MNTGEDFRRHVVELLAAELPVDWPGWGALPESSRAEFAANWRRTLVKHQLLGASWPVEYGGAGHGLREQAIIIEECVRAGVPMYPHPNDSFGLNLLGPTLLHSGTEDQKRRFLLPTLHGEIHWAQGFSEPDAGLQTCSTCAPRRGSRVTSW